MDANIFGVKYKVKVLDLNEPLLAANDGMCKIYDKEILLRKAYLMGADTNEGNIKRFNQVLRHELVHACAQECGVSYGDNEELVDWIAHIIPTINREYEKFKLGHDDNK